MERINIPASVQNLANVDKLQQKETTHPVVTSLQNSEIDQTQRDEKLQKPNQVDESENQIIDPDEKKEQGKQKKKKRERRNKPDKKNRGRSSGKFVDYSA